MPAPSARIARSALSFGCLALVAAALALPAAAASVTILGHAADYEADRDINDPPDMAPPLSVTTTAIAGADAVIGVNFEDNLILDTEDRMILQFDLSSITGAITSATFKAYVEEKHAGFPQLDVALYGSTLNRPGPLTTADAAAPAEFDAPSYVRLDSDAAIFVDNITTPEDAFASYDVTTFIQARYADFLLDPSKPFVFFRLQNNAPFADASSFYDFASADSGAATAPRLEITTADGPGPAVPLPSSAWAGLTLLALVVAARFQRQRRRP